MVQGHTQGEKSGESLKSVHNTLIALGGNLTSPKGSPQVTLREAISALEKYGAVIRNISPFYHTPAFPAGNGPDYVNAAAQINAPWSPQETLEVFHKIEADLGRERVRRWGQRTLDIDMIAFDDLVLPDLKTHLKWRELPLDQQIGATPDKLILPHPRLQDRAFVLVPLADIAPDWVHPILGQSVKSMLDALPEADKSAVRRIE